MEDYGRLIFLCALAFGFGPIFLLVVYCLFTGRMRWLFSKSHDADGEVETPAVARFLVKLHLYLFPIYLMLLGLLVYLGL